MKEKIIIAALAGLCLLLLFAAFYFKQHQEKIIVNLKPVGARITDEFNRFTSPFDYK